MSMISEIPADREMTETELSLALHQLIVAEHEAIQLYEKILAAVPKNHPQYKLITGVLSDVNKEEKIHVGEFVSLLMRVQTDTKNFYIDGDKEVADIAKEFNTEG